MPHKILNHVVAQVYNYDVTLQLAQVHNHAGTLQLAQVRNHALTLLLSQLLQNLAEMSVRL